jgi:hypothetical protein
MKYKLGIDGEVVGIYSLEELRERVATGELSGKEFILGEGWTVWRSLDLVLLESTNPVTAAKRGLSRGQRTLLWVLVPAGLVIFIAVAMVAAYFAGRKSEQDRLLARAKELRNQQIQQHQEGRQRNAGQAATAQQEPQSEAGAADEAAAAFAAASKPIAIKTNSMTTADARRRERDFYRRQWVDGLKERGLHNSSTDAKAQAFLEACVGEICGVVRDTNLPPAEQLATELAKDPGKVDPIVLTAAAIDCPEAFEARRRLQRALNGFENSPHRAFPKFYANVLMAAIGGLDIQATRDRDATALQLLKECFADGSFAPADQNEIAEIFLHQAGEKFFERNADAVTGIASGAGTGYKWLHLVLRGRMLSNNGWAARGGGYADTVSEKGWQMFYQDMKYARMSFSNAWKLRPDLPAAPSAMVSVANSTSNITETRWWFDKATEAQMDYAPAWDAMRFALRPRWHGTEKSMLQFGLSALKTRRFDTDVPRMLLESLRDVSSENPSKTYFSRYDLLKQVFDRYIAASPPAEQKKWRGLYAAIASETAEYEDARKQLEALNWEAPSHFEIHWDIDLALVPAKVAAHTGPSRQKIEEADLARLQGALSRSLTMFTALDHSKELDERTRQYVQCRIAGLDMEKSLESGAWVDFLPHSDTDPNWVIQAGKTHVGQDGALEVESDALGHFLWSRAHVGNAFEIRGEFDVVRTSTHAFQAGIVMGMPDLYASGWNAMRVQRNDDEGDVVSYSCLWNRLRGTKPVSLQSMHNSFDFRMQFGQATATVNGLTVFKNAPPPEVPDKFPYGNRLGLGAFNDMNDTVIRYSNVQVRKLTNTR